MNFPEEFRLRIAGRYSSSDGDPFGVFLVPGRRANGRGLQCIATNGDQGEGQQPDWEHVSVSVSGNPQQCPSWTEMCVVKRLFWEAGDCVVQFHPREEDYVNQHPGVLHLWRCRVAEFPVPPKFYV